MSIKKAGEGNPIPGTGMPEAPGLPQATGMPTAPGLRMPEVQSAVPAEKATAVAPPPKDGRGRDALLALANHPLFGERPEVAPSDRPSLGNAPPPSVHAEQLLKEFENHADAKVREAVAALRKP